MLVDIRIACWSGPRNISTALMRSWSSRNDTFVSDEPFYAYYLKETGLNHPMAKEIINYYPNTYDQVVKSINKEIPQSKKIWYQKHMAHHLIDLKNIDWIKGFYNCFLIRHPKDVIQSYTKKNQLNHSNELGYIQQYQLIQYLHKMNYNFIVIDSSILLKNPEKILKKWCSNLDIKFDKNMLRWSKKIYNTDGLWAKHWYDSVIKTDSFSKEKGGKNNKIEVKYHDIYKECLKHYEKMLLLSRF